MGVFRRYRPVRLEPYPGVPGALDDVARSGLLLGVVTDGDPGGQEGKLIATGLSGYFSAVVFSDEDGRAFRKPNPAPFLKVLDELDVGAENAVVVGDRPDKDGLGAANTGILFIRVRTGEYASLPDAPGTVAAVSDFPEAARLILKSL